MSNETIRQQMMRVLAAGEWDLRALSQALHVAEKEVVTHLPHVRKSLAAEGRELVIRPAFCWACGFRFEGRRRFKRPGRCPQCRQTRIEPPAFHVA
jgi:predicted Zn-ribbon and HTH transcriptional regulator